MTLGALIAINDLGISVPGELSFIDLITCSFQRYTGLGLR